MLINSVVNTVCSLTFYRTVQTKSAFNRRFFISVTGIVLSLFLSQVVAEPNCRIKEPYSKVRVDYVIDGDTVVLANAEKVRLIGIDTPELGNNGKASQAYAVAARDFVRSLLVKGREYDLSYGIERRDRHGRTLGHLFLKDGQNLQAKLLAMGYATPLNIPPNILFSDCYQEKTRHAIINKLGIWKLKQYQERQANTLTENDTGYRIVSGHVTQVANNSAFTWLNLDKHLRIRIKHRYLEYFPDLKIAELKDRKIKVRGKIYIYNNRPGMDLRYPYDLILLSN